MAHFSLRSRYHPDDDAFRVDVRIAPAGDGLALIFAPSSTHQGRSTTLNKADALKLADAIIAAFRPEAAEAPAPALRDRFGVRLFVGDFVRLRDAAHYSIQAVTPFGGLILEDRDGQRLPGSYRPELATKVAPREKPVVAPQRTKLGVGGHVISVLSSRHLKGGYVNVVEKGDAPTVAYGDLESAQKEALRLAEKEPGTRVFTLEVTEIRKAVVTTSIEKD